MKYGIRVPRNAKETAQFDKENGNSLWANAILKEVEALMSMIVFRKLLSSTGYERGGRCGETWWLQTAARKNLISMLKDILAAARELCWKSGRRGRGGGDREAEESETDVGRYGYWDAGMELGDAQVGK